MAHREATGLVPLRGFTVAGQCRDLTGLRCTVHHSAIHGAERPYDGPRRGSNDTTAPLAQVAAAVTGPGPSGPTDPSEGHASVGVMVA